MVYKRDNTKLMHVLDHLIATCDLKAMPASWAGQKMMRSDALANACEAAGVSLLDVRSDKRTAIIGARRAWVCHLMRMRGMSYPAIGDLLRKDHTSVIYACRAVTAVLAWNEAEAAE